MSNDLLELALDALKDARDVVLAMSNRNMLGDAEFLYPALAKLRKEIAALEAGQGVPAGWKLVPIEPTEAMLFNGHMEIDFDRAGQNTYELNHDSQTVSGGTSIETDMRDCWAAMLAAAPSLPVEEKVQYPPANWRQLLGEPAAPAVQHPDEFSCPFCFDGTQSYSVPVVELQVVRWMVQFGDGSIDFWGSDPKTLRLNPEFDDLPVRVTPLVSLSDAQAAIGAKK